jgi:hypothetical protein
MTRTLIAVALAVCCLIVPSAWSDAAVLYGADGAQGNLASLRILDPDTGSVLSTVGPIGFGVTGLAVHPVTGVMYGSVGRASPVSPASLITIDKTTGAGTLVGPYNIDGETMADIAFGPDGTLYGWAEPGIDALHTINLATGQATLVGSPGIGLNTFGSGLAATFDALVLAGRGGGRELHRVDPDTGAAIAIAFLDWDPDAAIAALTFAPDGTLFGLGLPLFGDSSILVRISPVGGHVTIVGPSMPFGDAIAFDPPTFPVVALSVPTLSELAFGVMALLLTAVAFYQMRRRRA